MTEYTDTELLDFLQSLNDKKFYTGKCVLRPSSTGRGWRLHETSLPNAVSDVRKAIILFMEAYKIFEEKFESEGYNKNK